MATSWYSLDKIACFEPTDLHYHSPYELALSTLTRLYKSHTLCHLYLHPMPQATNTFALTPTTPLHFAGTSVHPTPLEPNRCTFPSELVGPYSASRHMVGYCSLIVTLNKTPRMEPLSGLLNHLWAHIYLRPLQRQVHDVFHLNLPNAPSLTSLFSQPIFGTTLLHSW